MTVIRFQILARTETGGGPAGPPFFKKKYRLLTCDLLYSAYVSPLLITDKILLNQRIINR